MNRYLLGLDRAMNVWAFPHDRLEAQLGLCARFFYRNSIPVSPIIKSDYSQASCQYHHANLLRERPELRSVRPRQP
jgi:hypothetical protein